MVVLDIGGVLTAQDFTALAPVLREGTTPANWAAWLLTAQEARDFECGRGTASLFWEAVRREIGREVPLAAIEQVLRELDRRGLPRHP